MNLDHTDPFPPLPAHWRDLALTWSPRVWDRHRALARALVLEGFDDDSANRLAAERVQAELTEASAVSTIPGEPPR